MNPTKANDPGPIKLPRLVGGRDVEGLCRVAQQIRQSSGAVILDGSATEFFDPLGIAALGALLEPLSEHREIRMDWLKVDVGTYLDRMDVLNRCGITAVETRCQRRNSLESKLVELTRVSQEHEVDDAAARLADALAGKLIGAVRDGPSNEAQLRAYGHPLRYALTELLLNALSHAKREGHANAAVWVAAQFYPGTGRVQLAVVDNGCGILATLQNSPKLKEKTHIAAIPAALSPFVSCNPDLGLPGGTSNRGVGLTTTSRIANAARGHLLVVSGDAYALSQVRVKTQQMDVGAAWNGVAILLTCERSKLPGVNIPQLLPPLPTRPSVSLRFDD